MNFDRTAYGARIKKLRIANGYTQNQLGEILCVTGTYIGKIETGLQTGSIELAVELSKTFRVSIDFLLLGTEPFTDDKKQTLRKIIAFLSEIENDY